MNIQLRWAKTDSKLYGGTDTWNLFYQTDSTATGTDVAWRNAGVDYTFGANGQMIAGRRLDDADRRDGRRRLARQHRRSSIGSGGLTQFADPNGNVQVNLLQQNGFAAGSCSRCRSTTRAAWSAPIPTAAPSTSPRSRWPISTAPTGCKRIDGGAFVATDESGPPTYNASGKIVGSSLEGSNTDIADEFTKLIVTQQAYSANTRVITTSNQMVQDLLNMLR